MDEHLKDRLDHLTPSEKQKMLHDHVGEIYGATGVDPKKEVSTAYGETGFEGDVPDAPAKVNPNRKQRREAIKKQKKLDEKRRLEAYKRAHRHQSRH